MTFWIVQTLNGISFGVLLFLLAAGLSLIYGLMKILNLTHGSYYLLGGYLALAVLRSTGSFLLAIVVATAAIALLGAAMERFFLRRFHLDELAQTLLTFSFLFVFADLALWIWGGNPQTLPKPAWLSGSIALGDRVYPTYRLFLIASGLAVGGALWWFQERTRVGAMLRAGVDDQEIARGL